MTPELQNLINAQQQSLQQAQFKMYFLGYTYYAAVIVCAVFAVLIFWKLCQIQQQLLAKSPHQSNPFSSPSRSVVTETIVPSASLPPVKDDSRYKPKG